MPTVLRKDGFTIRIYFNDHLPYHVHVFKAEGEVKINLDPEEIITVSGKISNKEVIKGLKLVAAHRQELIEKWREIHEVE